MSIIGNPILMSGGGGGVPLLTRAQWTNFTPAQKQAYGLVAIQDANSGFDRGELVYGADYVPEIPLIPVMTSYTTPSGVASDSSYFRSGFEGWKAFDGNQATLSSLNGCWLASSNDPSPYLAYEFAAPSHFYLIWVELMNNSSSITVTAYIEGLVDGSWENCLANEQSVSLSFPRSTIQTYTFSLNGNLYDAIRIRGVESWYKGAQNSACGFSRVQVYGG